MRDAPCETEAFEELSIRIAGAISAMASALPASASRTSTSASGCTPRIWPHPAKAPSDRDLKRVAAVLRRIEAVPNESHSLKELAAETSTSPYHLLRTFEQVVGVTPHQFLLRTRLRHAAVRLRTSEESIGAIALDCGFGDLSTFNRHFRRLLGVTPRTYRTQRHT